MAAVMSTTLFMLTIFMIDYGLASPKVELPIVTTKLGMILPKPMIFSPNNLNLEEYVFAYLGIPYAEPPLGERRFRPPQPVQPWEDVLNATVNPPACPQVAEPGLEFSEDCLYVNVFAPRNAHAGEAAAVMVFLHGGGFRIGSGNQFPVVPLAAVGNVIVVTLNYRLNIFGFFTTGDDGIPPNLGLLDQRRAMHWVYQNIHAFGGDPQKITLFGWSAGAASAGWHILSEDSRQYFQRAILQSGVPLNPWAEAHSSREQIQRINDLIGDVGGCGDSSVAECLRAKTVDELLSIEEAVVMSASLSVTFVPSIDGEFFTSDISNLLQNGSYHDIEIMIGTNQNEGSFGTFFSFGTPVEQPFVTRDHFSFFTNTTDNELLTGLLEAIYTDGIDNEGNYEGALSSVLSDVQFTCGASDFARQVAVGGSKVYMYLMTHAPMRSIWNTDWLGATHGEELPLVFGHPLLDDGNLIDAKVSFYVIQMWANFAKTGDPNIPYKFPRYISDWPQFNPDTAMYKELDINFSNGQKLRQHYCNFWDTLVPQVKYLETAVSDEYQGGNG